MIKVFYSIVAILIFGFGMANCSNGETIETTQELTAAEKEDLTFLREEEKLARDVYLYAYDQYGMNIFNNISQSEQRHMDAVLSILNTYNFPDQSSTEKGVFNNSELQDLYDALTAKVDISLIEALTVGATIEDLDIKDINEFKGRTQKEDISSMYDKLLCGSGNHIRAYNRQILSKGGSYIPEYLSQDEFDTVINSSHESCGGH